MIKKFYVCSYGGSGSKMLCRSLRKYGEVYHIHTRYPPDLLEYIGNEKNGKAHFEQFNGIPIPQDEIKNYKVIYIYRNPSFSIESRFKLRVHLDNIGCNNKITINDVISSGKDLYKIREFYDNYTKPNDKRNYKIYCVKYEDIFDKQDELSKLLGIGKLNLVNKSSRKNSNKELDNIYRDLINEIKKNNFIIIN